jgi:ATP-binding cassette subfamily F protein 3
MLQFSKVALSRGSKLLVENVTFALYPGERAGLVGANGVGKSTLFSAILGKLDTDDGKIGFSGRPEIASLSQEIPETTLPAIDYVLDGDVELRQIEKDMNRAGELEDMDALSKAQMRYEEVGGYTAQSRAAKILSGLGFAEHEQSHPVNTFSGGWRTRINLAQTLMCRSDILLLDEPTNHLDFEAIVWLERWLKSYQGGVMLISHDREFLDNIVGKIFSIEKGKFEIYTGNYSDYEHLKRERLALQQSMYEKQQRHIQHLQSFVDRFQYKASKAKQAQSRIKMIAKMEDISAVHASSPFQFSFKKSIAQPDPMLRLDDIRLEIGGKCILSGVDFTLHQGDYVGLLGVNGAGKSTLLKLLAGKLAPVAGEIIQANGVSVGYYAQYQLELLEASDSAMAHFHALKDGARDDELRKFLGSFGFKGDKVFDPVGVFSGGEKARLVLALLVWQSPNLLLMDEPTNHLDIEMREALIFALQEFEGTVVVVSHDRHLLRTCTDRLLLVANSEVNEFKGDLDDYEQWILTTRDTKKVKKEKKASTDSRGAQKKLLTQQSRLEKEMASLTKKLQACEEKLAETAMYQSGEEENLKKTLEEVSSLKDQLKKAEAQWEEVVHALEK